MEFSRLVRANELPPQRERDLGGEVGAATDLDLEMRETSAKERFFDWRRIHSFHQLVKARCPHRHKHSFSLSHLSPSLSPLVFSL